MDEQRLEQIWQYLESQGQDVGTFEEFKGVIEKEPLRLRKVHQYLTDQGQDVGTWTQFSDIVGIKPPSGEENYFDLGTMNDTWLGDWVDDMARAISRGNRSGDAINETLSVMLSGSSITPENLQEFIDASNRAQELGQSDEMTEFMEAGGFSTWEGWDAFFANGATIIPELIGESIAGMVGNWTTGTIIGAGAAITAGSLGSVNAMPVALGAASGILESSSKFGELLREEVAAKGLEFNKEGVRAVLEDEESFNKIRTHALARGLTIGVIDGLTGRMAGTVGAKVLGKGATATQKAMRLGKGFGIEVMGGAGGEFAAQVITGEQLDVTSIGLEAFAEIGSGAPNVFTPIIVDNIRQRNGRNSQQGNQEGEGADGVVGIDPESSEAQYTVNNERVTREEMEQVIDNSLGEILNGNINIGIRNDPELSSMLETRVVNSTRRTQNITEDGNTQGLDTSDVQADENIDTETDQVDDTQGEETVEGENTSGGDVSDLSNVEISEETGLDNNQNQDQDGETNERDSEAEGEGEPVQRGSEDVQTSDTDPLQEPDNAQAESNEVDGETDGDGRETIEPTSQNESDRADQAEAREETSGLAPDEPVGEAARQNSNSQDAYQFSQIDEASRRVDELIDSGRSLDEAFDAVKGDFVDETFTETKLRTAVEARRREYKSARDTELNAKEAYADIQLDDWGKFTNWFRKNLVFPLRGRGPLTTEQFAVLERKRGFIQANIGRAKALGKKITKLTKNLSEFDKEAVDKMLKGAHSDILSDNVDAQTKQQIRGVVQEMRDRIDGLSRQLEGLGVLEQPLLEIIRDNEGKYVTRIYMKNLDRNWNRNKVPKNVWVNAKAAYRTEMIRALNDGRVSDENKARIARYLSDDESLDAFMDQILQDHQSRPGGARGGFEGSKDMGIFKARKDIPKVIREFYGEITDAETNVLETVTRLATFIANTRMLRDLQSMGFSDNFISRTPRRNPDGTQWVEFNAQGKRHKGINRAGQGSPRLAPLESPIYVEPEIAKFLEITMNQNPWWVRQLLRFNGAVKSGKTVYSPVTQVRNFLSAGFWMMANGNWNPANFAKAASMMMDARKVALATDDASVQEGVRRNNRKWERLVELQVADQTVTTREIESDFFKSVSGDNFQQVWQEKAPKWMKWLVEAPRQFYSDVDDFYRISYFFNQEKLFAKALYDTDVDSLTDAQRTVVEERAAQVVRDTYPNYSKIYPLVSKLRQFPFMGAFVSFSAEMVRTTRNQFLQMAREARSGNPTLQANALKRAVGLAVVGFLTYEGVKLFNRENGFEEKEEKDVLHYRPPWVETMMIVEDKGNGQYTYINPSTINPYGYFSDIVNAGKNAGGLLTTKGAAKATLKTLDPFIGPEVSVDVMIKEMQKAMDDDNPATSGEKIVTATTNILKGLQPGVTYSFGRIVSPKVDQRELNKNPDLIKEKRWNEIYSLLGARRSPLNVKTTFSINKSKEILKPKRRARKNFNSVWYKEVEKPSPDIAKINRAYSDAVKTYNEFLDKARENASRMRRLHVSEADLLELHKRARFDSQPFSTPEIEYALGIRNVKPLLGFEGYNKGKITIPTGAPRVD